LHEELAVRKVTHEERLQIAGRICPRILDAFGENVLAVFITGSTAKSLDRPYSDLEMSVVVKDGKVIPSRYYVYDGLVVNIDYPQESALLKEALEPGRDWPLGADGCRNRIMLFQRDNWTRKLDEVVAENDRTDLTEALRFAAVHMTETLAAVRNAKFKDDMMDLRTRAFYMAWDTARVVYLLNRKYVLTTSWFWKQLFECKEQPKDFRECIEIAAGFVNSSRDEIVRAAERLWSETMLLVRNRGVSIESQEILV
jgi:kanamycin nucleotidyltransferase